MVVKTFKGLSRKMITGDGRKSKAWIDEQLGIKKKKKTKEDKKREEEAVNLIQNS